MSCRRRLPPGRFAGLCFSWGRRSVKPTTLRPATDRRQTPREASLAQLFQKLRRRSTSLPPALVEIRSKRVDEVVSRTPATILRLAARSEPPFDRSFVHADQRSDEAGNKALIVPALDFLITLPTLGSPLFSRRLRFRLTCRRHLRRFEFNFARRDFKACGLDCFLVPSGSGTKRLAKIMQKVPSVSNLHGLRRAAAGTFGIETGAVTGHDLNAGMALQPFCDRVRVSIRQKINNAIALQIADDRPVSLPAAPGPIVDADDPRRRERFGLDRVDHPQQGVATHRHRQIAGQSRTRFTARGQTDCQLALAEPQRSPGVHARFGQPLNEDALRTGRVIAAKSPGMKVDAYDPPMPRQIRQLPDVTTVHTARASMTAGTARVSRDRFHHKDNAIGTGLDLDDRQGGRDDRAKGLVDQNRSIRWIAI